MRWLYYTPLLQTYKEKGKEHWHYSMMYHEQMLHCPLLPWECRSLPALTLMTFVVEVSSRQASASGI